MTLIYNHRAQTKKRKALRHNLSKPEKLLWQKIRDEQVSGVKFRRQYSVGPYVIDFYAPKPRLAIEIDGEAHRWGDAPAYDRRRQEYIEEHGIAVIRFTNTEVTQDIEKVIKKIHQALQTPITPT